MSDIPVGLQLYSIRHDIAKDVKGTLKAVADMGYDGVEFAGPPLLPVDELAKALDETGLSCCGWHTPYDMVQDEHLDETIRLNQAIGNRFIIVPAVSHEHFASKDDVLRLADFFNALSEKLRRYDMVTGYHNHQAEFVPISGDYPWDILFSNTDDDVVMQLDTGNAIFSDVDVVEVLKRHPGRSTTVHLKPYSKTAGKDNPHKGFDPVIGDDESPWHDIFDVCESTGGTQWYIVEYESDAYEPMKAVDLCLKGYKKLRGK